MIVYPFLRRLARCLGRLGPGALRRLARIMASLAWRLLPARREAAVAAVEKHLRQPRKEALAIARRSFEENFLSFLEIFHAAHFSTALSVSRIITPEGLALLQAETAPIVVTTAHLGSWELMPGLAADLLPDRQGMVVVRVQKNPALNLVMAELRGSRGMRVVDHRQASNVVVPSLRRKGLVALLADHNTSRREAVFLPFLEDTAAVTLGPALLALRTKAAVFPVFLVRDGAEKHLLYIANPLHTARLTGTLPERARAVARFYTDAVAEVVKKHPEQWFWMHKRWKTRAKEEGKTGS
ncbi:MAG: lysophospholipid acyltransferase family protein [Desulfovibrio sp.]|nr:lysophospholipid acyltransferase family protein [Desulfovibrio sp.]